MIRMPEKDHGGFFDSDSDVDASRLNHRIGGSSSVTVGVVVDRSNCNNDESPLPYRIEKNIRHIVAVL